MVARETVSDSILQTFCKNSLRSVAPWMASYHFPSGWLLFLEHLEIDPVLICFFRVFIYKVFIYFIGLGLNFWLRNFNSCLAANRILIFDASLSFDFFCRWANLLSLLLSIFLDLQLWFSFFWLLSLLRILNVSEKTLFWKIFWQFIL